MSNFLARMVAAVFVALALALAPFMALGVVGDLGAEGTGVGDRPDLSGIWILDERASDDPAARRPRPDGGPAGGGRGGGGSGGRMHGGRGGAMPGGRMQGGNPDWDGGGRTGGRPDRATLQKRLARLEIFQAGSELNLTDGLDISRVLPTDGSTVTVWTERGKQQATAAWDGPSLEIRWQAERGPVRTTRYQLAADAQQLVVLEQISGPGEEQPQTLRLVYRRQE
ncbi:MAG: hypothetical protein R6X35_07555 [Candidatus Krumholzibacteriia bacterium]